MTLHIYVGSYTNAQQDSISLLQLDPKTAQLTYINGFMAGENPSYFALDQQQKHLYAVNERDRDLRHENGTVSAFSIDSHSGDLQLINRVSSQGELPVSLALNDKENLLLVTNYSAGNATVVPIHENHQLEEPTDVKQHDALPDAKSTQRKAHAHHVRFSPDHRFVFVVDLGLDQIVRYQLDADNKTLELTPDPIAFCTHQNSGPRHITFHPNGRFAYLIHEHESFISLLAYEHETGTFTEKQMIPTIPEDFHDKNQCGAIRVSPDGKFLYASNRGHNSIVMYAIQNHGAHLQHLQTISSGGDWPREFTLADTGNILLAANQRSNNITSFHIDPDSPQPLRPAHQLTLEKPVYLQTIE